MTTATDKRFRSASGKDVRIALTSGHIVIIGKKWITLAEHLHAEAYKHGCISDDMDAFKEMKNNEVSFALANKKVAEKDRLIEIITDLVEKGDPKDFLKSGKVDAGALTREYGKMVTASTRDAMWDAGGFEPVLFATEE